MSIDAERRAVIRRHTRLHRKARDPNYTTTSTKTQQDAVVDALIARLDSSQGVLNADAEAAAPGVFSVSEKLDMLAEAVREWSDQKLGRRRT